MKPMKPLRATMIRHMQLARLAPRTQDAYTEAVVGLSKFSWCSPDRLNPEQIRHDLHHLLVERQLAWSSCNQIACGRQFFSLKTLDWDVLHLNLPPPKGRAQLPQVLSLEALERLFISPKHPKHRALLMTTYAAGLRVSEVTRLTCSDIESERMLIRVEQGKGRKDRSTLLSDRLLAELRASWTIDRPNPWVFPGHAPCTPLSISAAQRITYRAKQGARIRHGKGIHTLRHAST